MIAIATDFEAGSIEVVRCTDPADIVLRLAEDMSAPVRQWFYFELSGAAGQDVRIIFEDVDADNANVGMAGMPVLWEGYSVLASYDRARWFPVSTAFRDGDLIVTMTVESDSIHFANFEPYSSERQADLVRRAQLSPRCTIEQLGRSIEGHAIDCLRIGTLAPERKVCWVIARQHPAETQGSWCVEGMAERLLDEADPLVEGLLDRAVFFLVPNMNPDGARRGHTRTNMAGLNLNRQWLDPSPDTAPEVHGVKRRMIETGMAFGLDIHAWTGNHNFACGPFRTPSLTGRQTEVWQRYEAALAAASDHFAVGWPYPGGGPAPGEADISMSWNHFSETFGAIGTLYELLFKDDRLAPDPIDGWNADKCRRFGHATVAAIAAIVDEL